MLLLSGDPALPGVLARPVPAGEPEQVEPGLHAVLARPGGGTAAARALDLAARLLGVRPLDPLERAELPGDAEAALLGALAAHAADPRWEVLVVDAPPLPAALSALALPERLRRHLRRLLPERRQAARALRPLLAAAAGVPMPPEELYDAARRADAALAAVERVLRDGATTVRTVLVPGPHSAARLRAALPALALLGHRPEAVLANRLLPDGSADPWLAGAAAGQRQALKELDTAGAPVLELPDLGRDPVGGDDLALVGRALHVPPRPGGPAPDPWTVGPDEEDGTLVWRLPLPGARRPELELARHGDELVLDVGGFRRVVPLPSALRRCDAAGARLEDGELRVRFVPDPGLWPRG
ncbi:hypothetical protein GCM10027168_29830 [Streptomyces capparidis]